MEQLQPCHWRIAPPCSGYACQLNNRRLSNHLISQTNSNWFSFLLHIPVWPYPTIHANIILALSACCCQVLPLWILEMMKRMVYKTPHPSLVDLFGGLRHVSCLQKPTVKVLNIALLVWSSFSPHICISSKKHFLHSSLLQLLRAQGTEEMGQGLAPLVHTTFTQQSKPPPAHSDVSRFSVHWHYMLNFQLRAPV